MRVFLSIGRLTHDDFNEVMDGLGGIEICGVLASGRKCPPDWQADRTGLETWTYQQLAERNADSARTPLHQKYEEALNQILADPRSHYLIDRLYGRGGLVSVFNNSVRIEKTVWNTLALLFHAKPDRIVGTNTPHNIDWFVCRVAELIGIDVVFTQTSPLLWRTWVVVGTDEQIPVPSVTDDHGFQQMQASEAVMEFIERVRSSYARAIPDRERQRKEKYKGEFFNIWIELQSVLSSGSLRAMTWNAYSAIRKHAALKAYISHSGSYASPDKFISFFLHFQPERTTLPEGYQYVQQWLAIRALCSALPDGWHLVVKEHPSTFRNVFVSSARETGFYDAIAALPNTHLAPLELSPFELIDKSKAVVTVTGKVGVESLIRGKPVLVFGAAQYRGAKGVFSVKSIEDVRCALRRIASGFVMPNDDELIDYFTRIERNSFPKDDRINGSILALRLAMQCETVACDGDRSRSSIDRFARS